MLVLSDEWNGAWVQVDGTAEVLDMPGQEAEDGLVEYFRCISGEHPDWDEYRAAMRTQGKSLIRITPERWGPVATGGFPAGPGAVVTGTPRHCFVPPYLLRQIALEPAPTDAELGRA